LLQSPTGSDLFCYRAIPGMLSFIPETYRRGTLLLRVLTLVLSCSCITELCRKCFPLLQSCIGSALFCYTTLLEAFVADRCRKYKFSCYRIFSGVSDTYRKCSLLPRNSAASYLSLRNFTGSKLYCLITYQK
jgi:hypothetical protein